jgi:protein NrfD
MSVKGLSDAKFIMAAQVQRHWDWRVAFYLYGCGTSAGLLFVEVTLRHFGLLGEATALAGMWAGLTLAVISLGFLFDHLGPHARWRCLYVFRRPGASWIARGAIIVAVLIVLRLAILAPTIPGFTWLPLGEGTGSGAALRILVLLFSLAFMAYSGLVLSSWNSIAFWNTPMLPMLYIGYSFFAGLAALPLVAAVSGGAVEAEAVGKLIWPSLLVLLTLNGFGLTLYLLGMSTAARPCRESVRRLICGEQRINFWGGVVAMGLCLPLLAAALTLSEAVGSSGGAFRAVILAGSLAIQLGAFFLRDAILRVGVYREPV